MKGNGKETLALAAAGAVALLAARALYRRWQEYDLRGKTVLVTGGSRGLGLVLAREFAEEGANVAICARDPMELERARRDLEGRGARVFAFPCDVTERAQVKELVEVVTRHFGGVDVLVNNAGVIQVGPVEVMTLEDFEQAMAVHFWGPLYTTLCVLPQMRERRDGRIVNISSIGGRVGVPHLVPYCASKFALAGLSDGLRAELAKDNVLVTTVCPGLMRTGSPRNATFKGQAEKEYTWFAVSGSLPGLSINVERAARQIVNACVHGEAEVHLGATSKLGALFHGMVPGLSTELFAKINQLLPGAGEPRATPQKGFQSETPLTQSSVTKLTRLAEASHNQL